MLPTSKPFLYIQVCQSAAAHQGWDETSRTHHRSLLSQFLNQHVRCQKDLVKLLTCAAEYGAVSVLEASRSFSEEMQPKGITIVDILHRAAFMQEYKAHYQDFSYTILAALLYNAASNNHFNIIDLLRTCNHFDTIPAHSLRLILGAACKRTSTDYITSLSTHPSFPLLASTDWCVIFKEALLAKQPPLALNLDAVKTHPTFIAMTPQEMRDLLKSVLPIGEPLSAAWVAALSTHPSFLLIPELAPMLCLGAQHKCSSFMQASRSHGAFPHLSSQEIFTILRSAIRNNYGEIFEMLGEHPGFKGMTLLHLNHLQDSARTFASSSIRTALANHPLLVSQQ